MEEMPETITSVVGSVRCPTDRPVGVLVMILGSAFLAVVLFVTFIATQFLDPLQALVPANSSQGSLNLSPNGTGWQSSPQAAYGQSVDLGRITIDFVVFLAVAYCVVVILTGLGIYRGKSLGFSTAIVLFGLLMLTGSGWSILSLAIVVYCLLRKLNVIAS
jgi:hypothetical protein